MNRRKIAQSISHLADADKLLYEAMDGVQPDEFRQLATAVHKIFIEAGMKLDTLYDYAGKEVKKSVK